MNRPRRGRFRALVRAWTIAGLVVMLGASVAPLPDADAASEQVKEVARIPITYPEGLEAGGFPFQGNLMIDPPVRRVYQTFILPNNRLYMQPFDLDSLAPLPGAELPITPAQGSFGGPYGEFMHTLSEDGDSIFVAYLSLGSWAGIAEIDARTLELKRQMSKADAFAPTVDPEANPCTAVSCVPTPAGINPSIRGMSYVPAISSPASRDKLLLLLEDSTGPAASASSLVWVAQWDVETGRQDWIYRVNACGSRSLPQTPFTRYQLDLFQSSSGPNIYLGCYASGGTGQAVRLDQDGTSRPIAESGFPGPLGLVDVLADPGSDRLFLKIVNEEGESHWVFDGTTSSYVGIIGTTLSAVSAASGVDTNTGRLYVVGPGSARGNQSDPGGLFMADARRSPAPQAIVFPEYSGTSEFRVRVDPATDDRPRHVFFKLDGEDFFRVVTDGVDVSVDPPAADQDRFTQDVEERPGVTEANFTGTGHAYGLRSLFVGGIEGISPQRGALTFLGSPCMRPDREVVVGRVRRTALSNSLASATTIAGDAEATTRTDIQEPSSRCYPRGLPVVSGFDALSEETIGPFLKQADAVVGREWPFTESECAGDAETTNEADGLDGFGSSSVCRQTKEQVVASARGEGFTGVGGGQGEEAGPGVQVGAVYASTKLERIPGTGLVARSEAWARGISIPGVLSMEAAHTVAEAFAGGRPGTAGTTFKREICGLRIAKDALGTDEDVFFEGCYDPFEQIDEVGEQPTVRNQVTDRPLFFLINRALGNRGRIRVPEPDDELKQGTPGGYLASLQKNRGEEIQARAISNDASTEVPAFELIMFNDDQFFGRGRQLYQFAGVDASTTYGIFLPPTFDFAADPTADIDAGIGTLPNLLTQMTGGLPPFSATEAVSADALDVPANVIAETVNRVARAIAFFVRSPLEAALAAAVWLLLGFPFYLASRRRALLAERAS